MITESKFRYIEAPTEYVPQNGDNAVFLAGGITDCPNWQADICRRLCMMPVVLLNPRRANFPIHDPSAAEKQIAWEHRHLRKADCILFWFPAETLCPIVLYELGAWSMTAKTIFVGVHPDYKRRQDVEIQTRLVRPEVEISYGIPELTWKVARWAAGDNP